MTQALTKFIPRLGSASAGSSPAITVDITVTAASQTVALPTAIGNIGADLLIANADTQTVFVGFGSSAANAAVAISNGTTPGGLPVLGGTSIIVTIPPGTAFIGAIGTAANTKKIHFCVGDGS